MVRDPHSGSHRENPESAASWSLGLGVERVPQAARSCLLAILEGSELDSRRARAQTPTCDHMDCAQLKTPGHHAQAQWPLQLGGVDLAGTRGLYN